jgi:hypothetical protein
MTANCSATAPSAGARLEDRPTEANSLEAPLTERRLGHATNETLPDLARRRWRELCGSEPGETGPAEV